MRKGTLAPTKRLMIALHGIYWKKKLATIAGVHPLTVNRWCKGIGEPSEVHLNKVASHAINNQHAIRSAFDRLMDHLTVLQRPNTQLDKTTVSGGPQTPTRAIEAPKIKTHRAKTWPRNEKGQLLPAAAKAEIDRKKNVPAWVRRARQRMQVTG